MHDYGMQREHSRPISSAALVAWHHIHAPIIRHDSTHHWDGTGASHTHVATHAAYDSLCSLQTSNFGSSRWLSAAEPVLAVRQRNDPLTCARRGHGAVLSEYAVYILNCKSKRSRATWH